MAATIADRPTSANSFKSAQQETPSNSQESSPKYSFTFNRQPEVAYSNTLPNGNQYLPLFPILEAMGVEYTWNQSQNTIFTSNNGNTIKLQVGKDFQTLNGYPVPVSVSKEEDGEIWIENKSYDLSLLLGIDHIGFNKSEQQWQIYDFQQQTDRQTPLEKAAADLVEDYLAMNPRQGAKLLSPNANIRDFSPARVNSPLLKYDGLDNGLLDIKLPIENIEIKSARQLTPADSLNRGLVAVGVRYTTDYDQQLFSPRFYPVPGETVYEETLLVRADDGKMGISNVIEFQANRSGTGSPIPILEEEDYLQIAQEWQQRKFKTPDASYETLLQIVRDFVAPTLNRVNTSNDFHLPELNDKEVLARFSEEVRQSQGWQDFLSLEGSKDPSYGIMDATYSQNGKFLTATLIGNWVNNSVSTTPILMEVELVKNENNSWKFTRLADVRLYQNVRELELSEPQTYSKLSKFYSYLRLSDIDLGFGI